MEDLEAFLTPEQAVEAFAMLDNNGDGKLVLADIRDAVIKIYKERRNLALSLKVCHRLHNIPLRHACHLTVTSSLHSNSCQCFFKIPLSAAVRCQAQPVHKYLMRYVMLLMCRPGHL